MCKFKITISKRKFLKYSLSAIITNNIFFKNVFADEFSSYMLSGPLAGNMYYTKKKPGRWLNLAESHLPNTIKKNNYLEVSTDHEMKGFEHYIIKHVIFDSQLKFISEKIFDPSQDIAYSKHNISGYQDSIFIMSVCNIHDSWLSYIKL